MPSRSRGWFVDLLVLAGVCALLYLPALDAIGLTSWQESQRAATAREMWREGEWVVPLINGQPYLAKPPVFYWAQLAITPLVAAEPDERVLRLTSALFAMVGVLATYLCARSLVREGFLRGERALVPGDERAVRWSALIGSLCLACGPAYAYRAHLGELDIALPVSAVMGVGGLGLAWVRFCRAGHLAWWPILMGTAGCVLAALTKGPPGLGIVACGAVGAIMLHAAWGVDHALPVVDRRVRVIAGVVGALATLPWTVPDIVNVQIGFGAVILALVGAGTLVTLVRLVQPERAKLLARGLWSVQPWISFGAAVGAFLLWVWAVTQKIGSVAGERLGDEVESNLIVLKAEVPTLVLGDAIWSVGLGSALCIVALVWLWRVRPVVLPAGFVLLAWLVVSLAMFGALGKGIPRYLLPVWPAVAIIAGAAAFAIAWSGLRPRLRAAIAVVLAGFIVIEAAGFAFVRPRIESEWSPRELLAELTGPKHRIDPKELTTFQFWLAAVDYYTGARPLIVGNVNEKDENVGGKPLTEKEFADRLRATGETRIVLVREQDRPDRMKKGAWTAGPERLRKLGLSVEVIPMEAVFRFDNGRSKILVARVRAEAAR